MKNYSNLSDSDGEKLVNTARAVVTEYLKNKNKMKLDSEFKDIFSANPLIHLLNVDLLHKHSELAVLLR